MRRQYSSSLAALWNSILFTPGQPNGSATSITLPAPPCADEDGTAEEALEKREGVHHCHQPVCMHTEAVVSVGEPYIAVNCQCGRSAGARRPSKTQLPARSRGVQTAVIAPVVYPSLRSFHFGFARVE